MNKAQELRIIGIGFLLIGVAMLVGFALAPRSALLYGAANLALIGLFAWLLSLGAAETQARLEDNP